MPECCYQWMDVESVSQKCHFGHTFFTIQVFLQLYTIHAVRAYVGHAVDESFIWARKNFGWIRGPTVQL